MVTKIPAQLGAGELPTQAKDPNFTNEHFPRTTQKILFPQMDFHNWMKIGAIVRTKIYFFYHFLLIASHGEILIIDQKS